MRASLSRLRMLVAPITIGAAVLFSGRTEIHAEDVPSLQKENGPYMVVARVFRGEAAQKSARALASELKQEHKLPAYIYKRSPKGEGRLEEIAVLVGDAKTPKECESIWIQVKRISPRCLADSPGLFSRNLFFAVRTINPLNPTAKPPIK